MLILHSKLRRARETAEVLLQTASVASSSQSTGNNNGLTLKMYGELSSLGRVDSVSSLDGTDLADVFVSWTLGNIERRKGVGGGESGREVFDRAVLTLDQLRKIAMSSSSSSPPIMLAVTHSTYLRVLLSLVDDSTLIESALWEIQNGSFNVIDVNVVGKRMLRAKGGLELEMPEAYLIRMNEMRHLEGMTIVVVYCSIVPRSFTNH